jgi:hypothetical protein
VLVADLRFSPIVGAVNHQPIQPGTKHRFEPKGVNGTAQFDAGLLSDIFCVALIRRGAEGNTQYQRIVLFHKRRKRIAITCLYGAYLCLCCRVVSRLGACFCGHPGTIRRIL